MNARSRRIEINFPLADLTARVAAAIVAAEQQRGADLREVVVLVPDLHAAGAVAHALRGAIGVPVLLLPRITTLRMWAASVRLSIAVSGRSAREVTLYQALAQRSWLSKVDLWPVAQELTGLFEELIRHKVALARDADEFYHRIEAAYRARPSASLHFEARLVHELWFAMSHEVPELAPEAAYQLRLAELAARAWQPLYAIALRQLAPAEQEFFTRYGERASLTVFNATASGDALATTLATAWPTGDPIELRVRAATLGRSYPKSALAGRLRVFGASNAEQEAQAIDVTVREWRLSGKRSIAVVGLDRVVARRARALLERAAVLVSDEAGWPLSTTSAATALDRWLDVAANDAYHRDLLDLMKSPFAFFDLPRDARRQVVWRLERYVREANAVSGVDAYIALARRRGDAELAELLGRVRRAVRSFSRNRKTLVRWLSQLETSLSEIGVKAGLEADPAGEQLLELLAALRHELGTSDALFSFVQWRRWLARELEAATFHDRGVESPVVFTYLAATRLRTFDAVLICGCDAQHLPGPEAQPRVFNQGVRAELGLPLRHDELRAMELDLTALIANSSVTLLTWQRLALGEDNLLSPLVARLLALQQLAYGESLDDSELAARLLISQVESPNAIHLPSLTIRPQPTAPAQLVPGEISASAYNSLVACPYQFYARYILKLGELDEVQELIDKRDYGSRLHAVLAKFHRAFPVVLESASENAQRALNEITDEVFADALANNYLARAWVLRWKALIPAYLEWQREREVAGWRWYASEAKRRVEIVTGEGRKFAVIGRLDRVDQHRDGRVAVVDYKTTPKNKLSAKLKNEGEDVQLPLYALLWGGPVAAALFLTLDNDEVKPVEQGELDHLVSANRSRIAAIYDRLHGGALLPAHGIDEVCKYCEARGLCRKDYWT